MQQSDSISLLFETSWEVCNKIGGIYTVLSTKAKSLESLYGDNVIFIGPDVWTAETPSPYFIETSTPLDSWRENAWLPEGVSVRTGRWDIPGQPLTVLVKFDGMYAVKDAFYGEIWEKFGVDSLHAYGDYDEGCAFGHAAGIVIESIANTLRPTEGRTVAHFDEWTVGMGLLYLKAHQPGIATVFTTHATSIGRSICGNGKPLYDYLHAYNGDQMAGELNMQSKHSIEKAAAHQADAFTTVSDITADECAQLLERRPDVVTPNGFEADFVPKGPAFTARRKAARKTLLTVASALTGNKYGDDTFIVATSGRCEYRNKGLDVFLDSLDRLGELHTTRKILAFIMVPAWVKDAREDLRIALDNGQTGGLDQPVLTHWLNNPDQDPVLCRIRQLGFRNLDSDRISVIYVPSYLTGNDGIFDKTYYDLLIGMNATVFPSYYEPWGYTPLESIAFGVPTVTTSLSGFGRWILKSFENSFAATGVKVETRTDSDYDDLCNRIAADIAMLANLPTKETQAVSRAAKRTAAQAAWSKFISYYSEAYSIAEDNAAKRNK